MHSLPSPLRLISCDRLLAELRDTLPPVAPQLCALEEARGRISAGTGPQPAALPAGPVAALPGFAVSSEELIGAGPLTPLLRSELPPLLEAGEPLPPGTDAVLDPAFLRTEGPFAELTTEVLPGEGVLPPGHHLEAGETLLPEGAVISGADLLLAEALGLEQLSCRIPRVSVTGADTGPRAFLRGLAEASGAALTDSGADIEIRLGGTPPDAGAEAEGGLLCSSLMLNGPQPLLLRRQGDRLIAWLPDRAEPVVCVALGLLMPLLDHLSRRSPPEPLTLPLARKISSAPGLCELLPLCRAGDSWMPLPTGGLSLGHIRRAEAFLLIPESSEGWPAAVPLSLPLTDRRL